MKTDSGYGVIIHKKAKKFIESQQPSKQRLILNAIYNLPKYGDIKPVEGSKGVLRLRKGDYRIFYKVEHGELMIYVIDAENRGDAYK